MSVRKNISVPEMTPAGRLKNFAGRVPCSAPYNNHVEKKNNKKWRSKCPYKTTKNMIILITVHIEAIQQTVDKAC
jgi:hypothetical protein